LNVQQIIIEFLFFSFFDGSVKERRRLQRRVYGLVHWWSVVRQSQIVDGFLAEIRVRA
jgi:hypothetical protein